MVEEFWAAVDEVQRAADDDVLGRLGRGR